MDLTDINKYGFPFYWFVDVYDQLNDSPAYELNIDVKNTIDNAYLINYLNYANFIDEISLIINITPDDKKKYLNEEKKCMLCNKNYPHSFEIFTNFIDFNTKKHLNKQICFDCAYTQYSCSNCDSSFGLEPYENIYLYFDHNSNNSNNASKENKTNLFAPICENCKYSNKDLPLLYLLFKNYKIDIEFVNNDNTNDNNDDENNSK